MLYQYLVIEGRYNYDENSADVLFGTNDKSEAVQAAKDFGQGTVVTEVDKKGNRRRIFTADYKTDQALKE